MGLKIIFNERVIFDENKKAIIVADIHLGVERELRKRGVYICDYTEVITRRLLEIAEANNARELIILGDVKHEIGRVTKEVVRFFDTINSYFDNVCLLPGNHDAPIEEMKKLCNVESSRGILISDYFVWHGHTWPSNDFSRVELALCGHLHPEVKIYEGGCVKNEACWVLCELEKSLSEIYSSIPRRLLILPSFNPLVGSSVTKYRFRDSPLLKRVERYRVFLSSGVEI